MVEFSATLSDALAPVTLISGVGLLLVSMPQAASVSFWLNEKRNPKISTKKSTSLSTLFTSVPAC